MKRIRLGRVGYLNCLPVYYGIEHGIIPLDVDLFPGPPTELNRKFLQGKLDITPISSIEYARNDNQCFILPNMSISADGRVTSILLFSKRPVKDLEQKKIAVTTSSATSVVMLKVLMQRYWQVSAEYLPAAPVLEDMLSGAQAALLIGDDALRAAASAPQHLYTYDLGEVWKQHTGYPMVYALWVIRASFRDKHDYIDKIAQAFTASKQWGMDHLSTLIDAAVTSHSLPREQIADHFAHIKHQLDDYYREALLCYYREAHTAGLLEEVPSLRVWGE